VTTILLAGGGTGGHLMPALAVADATRRLQPAWRFVFAGATRGIEATVLPPRGVPHHLLPLEPLYRRQWWRNLRWPVLLPSLVRRIDAMLDEEQPAAVIGTGGYVSGPVLWRATRRGIATGILELDVRPGLATRLLAKCVGEIWLAMPETQGALPAAVRDRAMVTGAPIVAPDPARRAAAMAGSLAINRIVATWLRNGGADSAQVIWTTGRATHAGFAPFHDPPRVHVIAFLDPMADAWSVADLCVARSGMMTLAELCAWGIPSVLIPLPSAAANHQAHNAAALAAAGAAIALPQDGLDAATLGGTLRDLLADVPRRAAMTAAARARGKPGAAAAIAERVVRLTTG
jgi:UDP-N-acetylglucosamine--N-acetylmuramyl-(pentapeptide) pyrophosphoryl-undecaprenol N-acetylglucosamine transferase